MTNPVLEAMLNRKSIRKYTAEMPGDDVIEAIVRAGQQAPFAAQLGSVLMKRAGEGKKLPFEAPILFTICVDSHRLELIMKRRGWTMVTSDLSILLFGMQDAAYMAENMVVAAESLGLGSCFLGGAPYCSEKIVEEYSLPPRVFPLVQLTMGFPAEDPPTRPRYPIDLHLFEDEYREFSEDDIARAVEAMDAGYLGQDYYRRAGYMIPLEGDREETFTYDDYGWTEHISRKWGQWLGSAGKLLGPLAKCGFPMEPDDVVDDVGPFDD